MSSSSNSRPDFPRYATLCLAGLLALAGGPAVFAAPALTAVMPVPAEVVPVSGRLDFTTNFKVSLQGAPDPRIDAAVGHLLRRAEARTGLTFARQPAGADVAGEPATAALVIENGAASAAIPALGEDESYTLTVTPEHAVLRAPTTLGILHGTETFLQLLQADARGWFLPALTVNDRPRFPWRGLMLDVCRHWQPMEVIKRNLDAMVLVKLNVLHIHLTEDQGFRIESKTHPKLHELGSDGHYFTQDEMREIIAYAAARGIRVVPEFDIPGHATSWVTAYPQLGSAPGPYHIERKWGVFDPVLDPTNEEVYKLLDGFLGEMAALFPDPYLHIGGDENNGVHWNANAHIQAFIKEHNLKDNAGLHAYFNGRVNEILQRHGKKLVGWDEILHPDLPKGSVVHSWRGPAGIAEATKLGYATILSNGYYIDLMHPTVDHYLNDPIPPDSKLTPAQQKLVLGGEATMWAEWVTPETIDSRIWPRTAAIAERLWSPANVRDVPDMYRRLALVSRRLEEAGLHHESYIDPALRRLAGDNATFTDLFNLRALVDLLEPVKVYARGHHQPSATQFTPLTGLVDCTRADSTPCREFAIAVDQFLSAPRDPAAAKRVSQTLKAWQAMAEQLSSRLPLLSPRLAEASSMLRDLIPATQAGLQAGVALQEGRTFTSDEARSAAKAVATVAAPRAAVELPASVALDRLVKAAAAPAASTK